MIQSDMSNSQMVTRDVLFFITLTVTYTGQKVRDQTFKDVFFSRSIINQVLNYMVDWQCY